KRLSDSRHRSPDRRDAVSRRLRSDHAGVRQAGRREPAARLSADAAGSDGRRPGLQPSDRAVVACTDRGDPDVRRSAPRNRRRRAAVPALSLPCAGNDDRDRAALLPALVSRRGVARPQGAELKVHEYQGKEILRRFGIPTPRGIPAFSADEAVKAAEALGGGVWVVKAQIHAGGRGKGGGVKLGKSIDAVRELAGQILGMQLITHQTGPRGQKVRRLLIEEGADIKKELYVGMDIEAVAANTPDKIHKVFIDPGKGLSDREGDGIARQIGIPEGSVAQARPL